MASDLDLATYLRRERDARGLSLRALADRARVSKSTLGAWEKGTHQPSLYELDAVLAVYAASADERRRVLELIDAPRARREVQRIETGRLGLSISTAGAMLQAMRVRRGHSMAGLGRHVGVDATTIGRWERGESWPRAARLDRILTALGAEASEREALESIETGSPAPWHRDEVKRFLTSYHHESWGQTLPQFTELRLIGIVDALWPAAQGDPVAEELYRDACGCLASWYLLNHGALSEAVAYSRRALAGDDGTIKEPLTVWPAHILAKELASGGRPADQVRAVDYLSGWLPRLDTNVHVANWYRRDIAEFVARAGELDTALKLSAEAVAATIEAGKSPDQAWLDHAGLLLQAGRAEEALPLLPEPVETLPLPAAKLAMTWAEAMLGIEDADAACGYCAQAERIVDEHALVALRPKLRALSQNCGRAA